MGERGGIARAASVYFRSKEEVSALYTLGEARANEGGGASVAVLLFDAGIRPDALKRLELKYQRTLSRRFRGQVRVVVLNAAPPGRARQFTDRGRLLMDRNRPYRSWFTGQITNSG